MWITVFFKFLQQQMSVFAELRNQCVGHLFVSVCETIKLSLFAKYPTYQYLRYNEIQPLRIYAMTSAPWWIVGTVLAKNKQNFNMWERVEAPMLLNSVPSTIQLNRIPSTLHVIPIISIRAITSAIEISEFTLWRQQHGRLGERVCPMVLNSVPATQ